MGREIRRVPPHHEHPVDKEGHYRPMHEKNYIDALDKWIAGHHRWEDGGDPDREKSECRYFADWEGDPPSPQYFATYKTEEATWYQLYETVSEGTPTTPPFETQEQLIDHMVEEGSIHDGKWSRKGAEHLVKTGWQPSMAGTIGGSFFSGNALAEAMADETDHE